MRLLKKGTIRKIMICGGSLILGISLVIGITVTYHVKSQRIIDISGLDVPLSNGSGEVKQTNADINVIPDKYNTGCQGELIRIEEAGTYSGCQFKESNDAIVIDFFHSNKSMTGEIVFKNYDFTHYASMRFYNMEKVENRKIHVIFDNCKINKIISANGGFDNISFSFNGCTITSFGGSNATFNRCQFGHSYMDCMNPLQNVEVNDCFFSDVIYHDAKGVGLHTDGTQIYGNSEYDAHNISFNRCRFEIPAVQSISNDTNKVNACLMLQLEFSDGRDIHFSDCYVNGGGYTIYAWEKKAGINITDASFTNIAVGNAKVFGSIYPKVSDGVCFNNVYDQDSLYVSSVWQDSMGTHVITTNDTGEERTLKVITDLGEEKFTIPACIGGKDLRYANYDKTFDSFPFDIDIMVDKSVKYVVCYDVTTEKERQIRFVSFDGKPVYILPQSMRSNVVTAKRMLPEAPETSTRTIVDKSVLSTSNEKTDEIGGKCGDSVFYTLNSGTLTIYGAGMMLNYNSGKTAPWFDMADSIFSICIENGITSIGAQAFRNLINVTNVKIPESVSDVGPNAFIGCKALSQVELTSSVKSIGRYAFEGTSLISIVYNGTVDSWNKVKIGDHNNKLLGCDISFSNSKEPALTIDSGSCGEGVFYELDAKGNLHIFGIGKIKNYDSSKPAPWYALKDYIISIQIDEGITAIGTQNFRNEKKLKYVSLPESLVNIGNNAFIGCSSLSSVLIKKNVVSIGRYAFAGTNISNIVFCGDEKAWKKIQIGDHNEWIDNNIVSFIR